MAKSGRKQRKGSPLQEWIAKHGTITTFAAALDASEPRPPDDLSTSEKSRAEKKNYAERLSNATAVLIANKLRAGRGGKPYFEGVLPEASGKGQESRARTGKGVKKLDVNYSTAELGLGLGVSIKTVNFRDPTTERYTKNIVRMDNELRAEAMDYHVRQPYAVLVGLVLLPIQACDDGNPKRKRSSWSSFAHAVKVLRHRSDRRSPTDNAELFERIYIGLYETNEPDRGRIAFFDPLTKVKQFGRPDASDLLDVDGVITKIVELYDRRNKVTPPWEDEGPSEPLTLSELDESGLLDEPNDDENDDY